MRCAKRTCKKKGLISLSELCNSVYNGQDTTLLFCEDHVLQMLFDYKEFKDLEFDYRLVPFIRCPFSIFNSRMSENKLYRLWEMLSKVFGLRKKFQSQIYCKSSIGHDYWLKQIQEAIEYCDMRLWHPVCAKKRKRRRSANLYVIVWPS